MYGLIINLGYGLRVGERGYLLIVCVERVRLLIGCVERGTVPIRLRKVAYGCKTGYVT